ncbi:MAG: hypothetical protein HY719_12290 [Planctomycetes bacterium]|nr:hypothetical protein [Planctomycetota bacterium]
MKASEITGDVSVDSVVAAIRERVRTRPLAVASGDNGNGATAAPAGSSAAPPEKEVVLDQQSLQDIEFMNQRWDTCNIPMLNHHGVLVTLVKRIVNRVIRFNTFWQATFNSAATRVVGALALRLHAVYRNLLHVAEAQNDLHRRLRDLEKRVRALEEDNARPRG